VSTGLVHSTPKYDLHLDYQKRVDPNVEATKLRKEIELLTKDIDSKQRQLADETFRSRAPEKVVKSMQEKLAERTAEHKKLRDRLAQLEKSS